MVDIEELPDEIIEFIFTYLPPYADLQGCRLVSKRWNSIVKDVIRRSKMNLQKGLNDFRLRWELYRPKEEISTIAGRFSHSAVFHENSMYIFGGGSSSDTTFNDLWRFDLSHTKWERPISLGTYPSPKGSASMVCYQNQLILFGGWRYPSLHPPYQPWCLFDELHIYDLKMNRWVHVRAQLPTPPPMAGHSASVHRHRMIVFGGYQISEGVNNNSNDTWCLNMDSYTWSTPKIAGNTKPPPRYGQFQVNLDDDHLLIVGGCGGPNSIYTDAWVLDMSKELWQWKSIPVKNKKWGASHMWCNPACKVDSKLVVLGPTPNLPTDFQMMKQTRAPPTMRGPGQFPEGRGGLNRVDNFRMVDDVRLNRRGLAINNNHQQNNNNNIFPRMHAPPIPEERNHNRPQLRNLRNDNDIAPAPVQAPQIAVHDNNPNDIEAANRLQRNLALRCRDHEPRLPKRFDELYEDPFRMAAFNVQSRPRSLSKDHHERIRRMEEKMNAIRNSRRALVAEQKIKEPSPKRVKRNVLSLFVCDLKNALSETDPHLQWIEYKNYGIIPGAPERLILSSMVAGNGELILFGGVHKETLSEITHSVSNSVHFLSAPRDIV